MSDADDLAVKLAERIEDVYINRLCQLPVGTPWEKAGTEVEAILAPILAHNAAMEVVLRECREYVFYALEECLDVSPAAKCRPASALLSRIDALTAKGADPHA